MYPLNDQYATKEKYGRQPPGNPGNNVSLADGPDGQANGSYQFHGTEDGYIEFPNNAGTLDARHSITMLCWVYISKSSNFSSPLFIYYNKTNSDKFFGMAIRNAKLTSYFKGIASLEVKSARLESNHWHYVGALYDHEKNEVSLWVNGTIVAQRKFANDRPRATGYRAVRMGAIFLKRWQKTLKFKGRITAMQVYNFSLTEQQIEVVKYVSGRGKNISCKVSVC